MSYYLWFMTTNNCHGIIGNGTFRYSLRRRQLHHFPVVVHRPRRTDPRVRPFAWRTRRLVPLDQCVGKIRLQQLAEMQLFFVGARNARLRLVDGSARARTVRIASKHFSIIYSSNRFIELRKIAKYSIFQMSHMQRSWLKCVYDDSNCLHFVCWQP